MKNCGGISPFFGLKTPFFATNLFAALIFAGKSIRTHHLVVGPAVEHVQQAVFFVELFHTDTGAEFL